MEHKEFVLNVADGSRLDHERVGELVQLHKRAFSVERRADRDVEPDQHLTWKTVDSPFGCYVLTADHDQDTVGLYVALRRRWLVKSRNRTVRDVVDLAVDPDMRGQGIFRAMSDRARAEIDPLFDLSLVFLTTPQTRKVGYGIGARDLANRVCRLVWTDSASNLAKQRQATGRQMPSWMVALAVRATQIETWARYRWRRPSTAECDISEVAEFDSRVEPLIARASQRFDFIQERSLDFLNWRYSDPRAGSFRILLATSDGGALGYLVYANRGDRGYIADLLTVPSRPDVERALVARAMADLRASSDVDHIVCWIPRAHPTYRVMRSLGFLDPRSDPGAAYRPINVESDELSFLGEARATVHLMIGDSDHV